MDTSDLQLPAGWRWDTIGALADGVSVGYVGPTSPYFCEPHEGVPLIRSQNIRAGKLVLREVAWVSRDFHDSNLKSQLVAGDVLVTRVGANAGDVCIVPDGLGPLHLSSAVFIRPSGCHGKYIELFLRGGTGQNLLRSRIVGSVSERINTRDVESLPIIVPRPAEEDAIVRVLGTLDDKIELNGRICETLEEMARALFTSWFVDFDPVRAKEEGRDTGLPSEIADLFPDSLDDSDLGSHPSGWKIVTLLDIATITKGCSYLSADLGASRTALVTLKSFARGGGYRPDGLKPFTGAYKPEQVITPGDVLISCTDVTQAAEVIGRTALVSGSGGYDTLVASLDTLILRPRESSSTRSFLYSLGRTQRFVAHTYAHTMGTTVLHLSREAVPSFLLPRPPRQLIAHFDALASPMIERIRSLEANTATLRELRDALLPRLLSGELRVSLATPAATP